MKLIVDEKPAFWRVEQRGHGGQPNGRKAHGPTAGAGGNHIDG